MGDEHEIELDAIVAAKATGGTTTLNPDARDYVLNVLGEGASHEVKYGDHVFSAYPSPPPEEGEQKIDVYVSMAEPGDEDYASIVRSASKPLAEKVVKALEDYQPPNVGARRKSRKSRKTRKTRKSKKLTRRR
jgi:hypothetical protein